MVIDCETHDRGPWITAEFVSHSSSKELNHTISWSDCPTNLTYRLYHERKIEHN